MVNVVERGQVGEKLPKGWKWFYLGDLVNNFDGRRVPIKLDERRKKRVNTHTMVHLELLILLMITFLMVSTC